MNHEQSRFAMLPVWMRASYYNEPIFNKAVKEWIITDKPLSALYEAIALESHKALSNYRATAMDAIKQAVNPPDVHPSKTKWTVQTWVRYKHSKGGFEHVPHHDISFGTKENAERIRNRYAMEEGFRPESDHWTEYRIVETTT